jgi:hypothetical protein
MKILICCCLIFGLVIPAFAKAQESLLVDDNRAQKSLIVLRVQLLARGKSGDKYTWSTVKILKIYKNDSGTRLNDKMAIAFYSGDIGISAGASTIYLEKYNPARTDLWKLLNASGRDGVSHRTAPPPKKVSCK